MVSNTLISAGVSVTVTTEGAAPIPSPTTVPLIFIATRANKQTPDGTGIALGTVESNVLRAFTSPGELLQAYGNVVFVTSDGLPVQGDETNEYGLITAYTMAGITNFVYIVRADIDLGQLVSTSVAPVLPPPDGTYWINTANVIGGIFQFNGSTWTAVPFKIYTTTPIGTNVDANGDWGFDYSTLNGQIVFKAGGVWYPATTANLTAHGGATDPLYVQSTTPVGAVTGDYWYKTTSNGGGTNLNLAFYQANTGLFITTSVIYSSSQPSPIQDTIWEDDSQIATTANRPLNIGTGEEFITLPVIVQPTAPTSPPATGTLWYNDYILDFAMYVESGNLWVPVVTTTVSNPTRFQKVISDSPPQFPSVEAIWIDTGSDGTNLELDNFPIVKYWSGSQWIQIAQGSTLYIQAEDPIASLVLNGSYWINTGELLTQNIVKSYQPTFVALTVNDAGATVPQTGNFWEPQTGAIFGRRSQRQMVVNAMKQVIASNQDVLAEVNYFQLTACPFYCETYDDLSTMMQDTSIPQTALALFDIPRFVIPSGIPVGRQVTIASWISDANNVAENGDLGFVGAPDPYQATFYPGGLATNPTDGNDVYVPASYIALRTIGFNDQVAYPWYPPAGPNRGLVSNVSSVGYLSDANQYVPLNMNRGQRDLCYENAINPIANIPQQGLLVYGQKTRAVPGIVLDRINVVRLVCKMKYDLTLLMQPFLFELNNAVTQRNATVVAQRYLAGLQALNAIYDYSVLCDGTNNTPGVVSAHQLIVDIAIQPEISIEFIYVPILVLYPDQALPF